MQRGFSLVELSIVLVILGLLTGGILGGQSLIRAAEMRSVRTEHSRHVTALQTFRDKYFAVPGDMNNATAFWGKDNTNCAAQSGTAATPGTCNGNGDGGVSWGYSVDNGEKHRFWQQLSLAGIIEGNYPGTSTATTVVIGTDAPRSKLNNAGWGVGGALNNAGSGTAWGANGAGVVSGYGNYLTFGAQATNNNPIAGVLKAEEAWNIDTKMDDKQPGRGKVLSYASAGVGYCDARANNTDYNAAYLLNSTTTSCAFYFINAF